MINHWKTALRVGTALTLAAGFAPVARAAEVASATSESMGEIVVTARRMEERLQDVPISITVFNQQQLSDRNIVSSADLATYTPSLSVDSEFGDNGSSLALRGFTQAVGTPPSVGVYFADVVAPRGPQEVVTSGEGAGPGAFFDLQNVQVLKGPQGTLFGRNTTGGAILLVPQKPTSKFEGYVEGSAGNYDMKSIQGVVNTPLGDKVRVRLGVDHETRDGYLKNISGIGPADFNNIDYTAARLSVVVDVTPNLENYTIGTFGQSDNHGPMAQIFACNQATTFGAFACGQIASEQAAGQYAVESDQANARSYMHQWQVINTTTWNESDNLTAKNIFSYGQLRTIMRNDFFGSDFSLPQAIPGLGGLHLQVVNIDAPPGLSSTDQWTLTDEVQFQGRALDGKLTWQAGVYYERSAPLGESGSQSAAIINCTDLASLKCFDVFGALSGAEGFIGTVGTKLATASFRDIAGYTQATYAVTDQLKFTGGIRYTSDQAAGMASQIVYHFPQANTPVASCVSTLTTLAQSCVETFEQKSHAPTWLMDVDFNPNQDMLLYLKYARGYRTGGVSDFGPDGYNTYGPEKVDAYEAGAKTTFRGQVAGTFDVAGFYNDFRDQQILVGFIGQPGISPSSGILNAGKSRIWGFEVESAIVPVKPVTISASYAYLNTKLLSLAPVVLPSTSVYAAAQYTAVAGTPLPNTPKNKASLTASYHLPLPESIGSVVASATYVYTDGVYVSASTPFGHLPSYSLLNLNLNWRGIAGKPIDAEVFATNVTNKLYLTGVTQIYNSFGYEARYLGEPRVIGARLRVHFGSDR